MLKIDSLSKSFGHFTVWENVSLSVNAGEVLGLFGVNGSGKTTLLKSIAGIVSPNSGAVTINDQDIRKFPAARRHIGFLTHQSLYYHDLSCMENLAFTASLYKLSLSRNQLLDRLDAVGLKRWADEPAKYFSRGMHQRLAIAKSLLHDPDLILFDEPYTGLDEDAGGMLTETLRNLSASGRAVILVTHDLRQGYDLCSRPALLAGGSLQSFPDKSALPFEEFHHRFMQKERRNS